MNRIKRVLKLICPPIILMSFIRIKRELNTKIKNNNEKTQYKAILDSNKQDLDLYWDSKYAEVLETWGKDNVWNEIQLILASCKGKILDIACGTGITIDILKKYPQLDLYGFDISDLLINKAIEKNISKEKLKVADATKINYSENEFDYSFSIGSLEHFTEEGINKFIEQTYRITKKISFHQIPVSRSNFDEGWMKTTQSFFNNSETWWLSKFQTQYSKVYIVPSKWEDSISYGRWYICVKSI